MLILLRRLFLLAARHSANEFAPCSRSAASVALCYLASHKNNLTIYDFWEFKEYREYRECREYRVLSILKFIKLSNFSKLTKKKTDL